jgi:hypothetical protein
MTTIEIENFARHDVCVEEQEKIHQRSVTYAWKCKRRYTSVA